MSLKIIKHGLLDTVQDSGRYGFQHFGINPGGAMDRFSAALANALLGKDESAATIELHFPAATILFGEATIICLSGGNFSPHINEVPVPMHQPILVNKNTQLVFKKWISGTRCYLALLNDLSIEKWLNSYSTNLKAQAGGWHGRSLQTGDVISFKREIKVFPFAHAFTLLSWKADIPSQKTTQLQFIKGAEWDWLTEDAKNIFRAGKFSISKNSDRMGYRLSGENIAVKSSDQLVSTGVSFGTVQALPNGQLIILMADHQTTGGYPKVAHVISAHLPQLAQMQPGNTFHFLETDSATAEQEFIRQKKYLLHLKNACSFKIKNVLDAAFRF